MKTRLFALGSALLLALGANPVVAEILTVNVTAHVDLLYDPDNVLGGQISVGQFAKGSYRYETTVPNYWAPYQAENLYGEYAQDRTQGLLNFAVGPFTFESDSTSWNWSTELPNAASFRIQVRGFCCYQPSQPTQVYFQLMSQVNKPLASGASVGGMNIFLSDMSGTALSSGALPTTALNVASFPDRQAWIWGQLGGSWYQLKLQIDSMEVAPALLISPANSSFVRPQRIDPAVLLLGSGQMSNLRGSINGTPLPPAYLGQCQIAPPNTQNRPATTCPDIIPFLVGGPNHVEWSVDMTDGSTATKAVDWEVIE